MSACNSRTAVVRVHLHCAALRGARRHVAVAEAKLNPLPSFGLILSFARLIIALGQPDLTTSPMALSVLILVAGALWGSTALVIKPIPLRSISPEKVLSYQLAVAAVVGTVRVLALGERLGPIAASAVGECSVRSSDCRRHVSSLVPASCDLSGKHCRQEHPCHRSLVCRCLSHPGEPATLSFLLAAVLVVSGVVFVNQR